MVKSMIVIFQIHPDELRAEVLRLRRRPRVSSSRPSESNIATGMDQHANRHGPSGNSATGFNIYNPSRAQPQAAEQADLPSLDQYTNAWRRPAPSTSLPQLNVSEVFTHQPSDVKQESRDKYRPSSSFEQSSQSLKTASGSTPVKPPGERFGVLTPIKAPTAHAQPSATASEPKAIKKSPGKTVHPSSIMAVTPPTQDNTTTQNGYLSYSPTSKATKGRCYEYYLDCLGFTALTQKRKEFVRAVKDHVETSMLKFLRLQDNETAFKAMVAEFLSLHGKKFWGASNRRHLAEREPQKGFLWPRDTEREGSRLVQIAEDMFNYKATNAHAVDGKADGKRLITDIDFSLITGLAADAQKLPTEINPKKRQAPAADEDNKTRAPKARPSLHLDPENVFESGISKRHRRESAAQEDEPESDSSEWNVFENTTAPSYFRPRSRVNVWKQNPLEGEDEDLGNAVPQSKPDKGRRKHLTRGIPPKAGNRKKAKPDRQSQTRTAREAKRAKKEASISEALSSDSDAPLVSSRHNGPGGFTPSTTQTLSMAQTPSIRSSHPRIPSKQSRNPTNVVSIDSDSDHELPVGQKPTQSAISTTAAESVPKESKTESKNEECKLEKVKDDPLWAQARAKTTLLVKASSMPKRAQVSVPLKLCNSVHELFSKLPSSCLLDKRSTEKIEFISATYMWNKREHGIRKESPEDYDWEVFMKALVAAMESKVASEDFEVAMVLEVD